MAELDIQPVGVSTEAAVWGAISQPSTESLRKFCATICYYRRRFGTTLPCNRFDVGNGIEYAIADFLRANGLTVESLPNAKRIDLIVNGDFPISIKSSNSGDIRLHNSLGKNKDTLFDVPLLVLRDNAFYLLTRPTMEKHGIPPEAYLKNTGDALVMRGAVLTAINKCHDYPYVRKGLDLKVANSEIQHEQTSKLLYDIVCERVRDLLKDTKTTLKKDT